jgi:hypothetical protein
MKPKKLSRTASTAIIVAIIAFIAIALPLYCH